MAEAPKFGTSFRRITVFTNVLTPRDECPYNTSNDYATILVKCGASIGPDASILCCGALRECAFAAVGPVVTKDIPACAMVAGVPAKIIGWRSAYGDVLGFSSGDAAADSQSYQYKKISDSEVRRIK